MSKTFKKLMTIILSITVTLAFSSITAFADEGTQTDLTITNSFNMFKPTAAKLVTSESKSTLQLTYTSESYDKAYVGTSKEAAVSSDTAKLVEKDENGVYMIPLDGIDLSNTFYVAFHSVKNKGWYNRTFTINSAEKTLVTGNPGDPIVPDDYGNEWDEAVSVTSSIGMFTVHASKVTLNEDGTVTVKFQAGKTGRDFSKIALIEQSASEAEKDAAAIQGVATNNENNDYLYEISIPANKIGEPIPMSNYQVQDGKAEWHNWSNQQYLTVENTIDLVNDMIGMIQVQKNSENTEMFIELSKKYWDALSDEDKLGDDGYFSDNTGDASLDDPLNTAPDKEKELLVVSFGTSFNDSRVATVGAVEKALAAAYGSEYAVRRAFTAQIIINHVQARDGEKIDNVEQAMDKAVAAGVKEMIVQPTHLMSGAEYDELKEQIDKYADQIKIRYSKPLLDSNADKEAVAKAAVETAVADAKYASLEAAEADGTAFVFMGHGTSHSANATYTYMQQTMDKLGYKNCFVGTVEGKPAETALPEIKKAVEAKGYKKVVLRPLMVVAGDHANNDMAADEEGSWYYAFVNGGEFEVEGSDEPVAIGEGFGEDNVTCQITGLGEIKSVQDLYVAHTLDTMKTADPETAAKAETTIAKNTATDELDEAYNTSKLSKDDYAAIEAALKEAKEAIAKAATAEEAKAAKEAAVKKIDGILKAKADKAAADAAKKTKADKIKAAKAVKVTIKTPAKGKKAFTAKWKNVKKVTGYRVAYSLKKNFKGVKYKKVKGAAKKSLKIKKLKAKKTYYVKVQAYTVIDGKTYYGKWSKVKKVKTKK